MLNIDGDQISIGIDLDQGARLTSVQWRDMQFAVPFRGQNYTWGWFSMVPFAGRIRDGIIKDLNGNEYQLPNNFDPPHALIGFGATSSWEDIGNGAQYLELPEPFNGASVTQRYEILDNAIRWSLDYEATGCDLPVTLGFHPWFARDIGKALTITALNYLKYQGLTDAMLYVDFDNKVALNLYDSLGFKLSSKDILYRL